MLTLVTTIRIHASVLAFVLACALVQSLVEIETELGGVAAD